MGRLQSLQRCVSTLQGVGCTQFHINSLCFTSALISNSIHLRLYTPKLHHHCAPECHCGVGLYLSQYTAARVCLVSQWNAAHSAIPRVSYCQHCITFWYQHCTVFLWIQSTDSSHCARGRHWYLHLRYLQWFGRHCYAWFSIDCSRWANIRILKTEVSHNPVNSELLVIMSVDTNVFTLHCRVGVMRPGWLLTMLQ